MNIKNDTKVNSVSSDSSTEVQYDSKKKTRKSDEDESFESFLNQNNNLITTYDMPYGLPVGSAQDTSFNAGTMSISRDDAIFFSKVLDSKDTKEINYSAEGAKQMLTSINPSGEVEKSHEVSKTLLNLIDKAAKTNQPVRLDFDNNISVILKVDQQGKLTAAFLPSDQVAEQYLRNNIAYLRSSLDSQNIDYNDIYYRHQNENNRKQRDNHQGDENE